MLKGIKRSQNSRLAARARMSETMFVVLSWRVCEPAEGGFGGLAGMKKDGRQAIEDMILMYKTMFGISEGLVAQKGEMSWPRAAPNGFESDASAVAVVRPGVENQMLL